MKEKIVLGVLSLSKSDESKKPFMYIHQPYIQVNEANNQEIYISRSNKRMVEQVQEVKREVEQPKPKKMYENYSDSSFDSSFDFSFEIEEQPKIEIKEVEEHPVGEFKKVKPQFTRRPSFKELSIIEKIKYLENYPTQLPPVHCSYKLESEMIKGKLDGVNDSHIELILEDGSTQIIEISTIQDILLPGLG